jgi:hypothetical protein
MNRHTPIKRLVSTLVAAAALTASIPAVMLSCDEATTAGRAITFSIGVMGAVEEGDTADFETAEGWTVTLSSAYAAFGPLYFYSGEAMSQRRLIPGIGVASACPTHAQYDYGTVLGEVLAQYVVDLLSESPTDTGDVDGEAGTCLSAEAHLHPPGEKGLESGSSDKAFDNLEGESILIEGEAVKDDLAYTFKAAVTIPDEGTMRIIQNIACDAVNLEDQSEKSGRLLLRIFLDAWFDQVDFSSLVETDDDGVYLFTDDTQAWTALIQAVRNRYSYDVVWSKK